MEFGKLDNVDQVNWDLPADDPRSLSFLRTLNGPDSLRIFFGAPAWGRKEWVGSIYPEKTKAADFLYHYSRYFSCIELNTSHYRIPTPDQAEKWVEQVPEDFLFCPKVFQGISHAPYGLQDQTLLKTWIEFLRSLTRHCGPSFLQLAPHFTYQQKAELFHFLQAWPDDLPLSVEFRHPSWFEDSHILSALTQYLQSRNIGLVITDVAGRRDVLHTSISADFALLRFIGNSLHPSDYSRAEQWAKRFKNWEAMGLKKLFLFIHEPDDVLTPEMTESFLETLKRIGSWDIRRSSITTEPPQLDLLF